MIVKKEGFTLSENATRHTWVRRDIDSCGSEFSIIASDLNDLREARNDADYDLGVANFQDERYAVIQYLKARAAYDNFQQLSSNRKKRAQIAISIRKFRNSINMPI